MPEFSAIPGSMWLADASEAVSEAAADMMIPSNVDIVDQVSTGGVPVSSFQVSCPECVQSICSPY